ncbi:hypothetical protein QQP08_015392 [Theobroma cacao]|nr:hypothetical protein QQP08_015392 [Theobroma cacao]
MELHCVLIKGSVELKKLAIQDIPLLNFLLSVVLTCFMFGTEQKFEISNHTQGFSLKLPYLGSDFEFGLKKNVVLSNFPYQILTEDGKLKCLMVSVTSRSISEYFLCALHCCRHFLSKIPLAICFFDDLEICIKKLS